MNTTTPPPLLPLSIERDIAFLQDVTRNRSASHFEQDLQLQYAVLYVIHRTALELRRVPTASRQSYPGVTWFIWDAFANAMSSPGSKPDLRLVWTAALTVQEVASALPGLRASSF